jgi:hypothetical protein
MAQPVNSVIVQGIFPASMLRLAVYQLNLVVTNITTPPFNAGAVQINNNPQQSTTINNK